jgi:hypothetical protein
MSTPEKADGPKPSPVVQELLQLFEQKREDGSLRFSEVDKFVLRAIMLLELLHAGEFDNLNEERQLEIGLLIHSMGIRHDTPPTDVERLIGSWFAGLKDRINPELFAELERIKKFSQDLQANQIATAAEAFRSMVDDDGLRAPQHDEKAPDDSKPAQSLAQQLGWKVRI